MSTTLTPSGSQARKARARLALRDSLGVAKKPDIVCLSHLRWNFVYQRPQHLMSRFAREQRVYFVEEPVFEPGIAPHLTLSITAEGVFVAVPHLPAGISEEPRREALEKLVGMLVRESSAYVLWYYTPMALEFTRHLAPVSVVYDCMDELSAFRGAPTRIAERERELLRAADVVFTGGHSLFEAKRKQHANIHPFPSSVDVGHFRAARRPLAEPADQVGIPRPRIGFFGVIDERLDTGLVDGVAASRPDWQLVLIGPTVKIDPSELPRRPNIHYLGAKPYKELPRYLAHWDVAILPFARNESTRFISPTKTPEYLAAGCPVVSTSIRDVVRPYGEQRLVRVADEVSDFVRETQAAFGDRRSARWRKAVDASLATMSWDRTWSRMAALVEDSFKPALRPQALPAWTGLRPAGEA
jgi:UDP-galactopyranose mutase